jgi:hypothetical protein
MELAPILLMEYHPTMDPRLYRGRIERFRLVRRVDWDFLAVYTELVRDMASSLGVPVTLMQSGLARRFPLELHRGDGDAGRP